MMLKLVVFGMAYVISQGLMAHTHEIYPPLCVPFVVRTPTLVLQNKEPSLVMIHNLSAHDVWMTHTPKTDEPSNTGWSRRLRSGRWSALANAVNGFEINCVESQPGHEQNIACANALAVCVWSPITTPAPLKHTLWAGEDRSLSSLLAYIQRQGFAWSKPSN